MITFSEQGHKYQSILPDNIRWVSITSLVGAFKEVFPREERLRSCSTRVPTPKKPNKWYKMPVEDIARMWDEEGARSIELGKWYHNLQEQQLLLQDNVYAPIWQGDKKIAPEQRLQDGIYPEHLLYLVSEGVCGQSDKVIVENGLVHVHDYKTNKELARRSYKDYQGTYKKMQPPLTHIEECDYNIYSLQLSMYMYMLLRHNPSLSPGNIIIEWVKFEEEGRNEFDYPIYKKDGDGYVVKDVEYIQAQYMKKECELMLKWLAKEGNRDKVLNRKK